MQDVQASASLLNFRLYGIQNSNMGFGCVNRKIMNFPHSKLLKANSAFI
jgi:hypothetical protein